MTPKQKSSLLYTADHLHTFPDSPNFRRCQELMPWITVEKVNEAERRIRALASTEDGWLASRIISELSNWPGGASAVVHLVSVGREAHAFKPAEDLPF